MCKTTTGYRITELQDISASHNKMLTEISQSMVSFSDRLLSQTDFQNYIKYSG